MKARLATIVTLLALIAVTGGALAIANSGGSGQVRSAASGEYVTHHHCRINGHYYKNCPKRYKHHFHCRFKGHYYKKCPYGRHVKGVSPEYPHHFHCRFHGKYYKQCPYGEHTKGVHKVRHK